MQDAIQVVRPDLAYRVDAFAKRIPLIMRMLGYITLFKFCLKLYLL